MSGYTRRVLAVSPDGSEGGYSDVVAIVNALLVSGTPEAGKVLIVGDDGTLTFGTVTSDGIAIDPVSTITALPSSGSSTQLYRLRNASTGEFVGLYLYDAVASTEAGSPVYAQIPTLEQVQNEIDAALSTVEVTLLASGWSNGTYTIPCTITGPVWFGMRSPEPSAEIAAAGAAAGLRLSAVGAASITITADNATPTSDIIAAVWGVTL